MSLVDHVATDDCSIAIFWDCDWQLTCSSNRLKDSTRYQRVANDAANDAANNAANNAANDANKKSG